MWARLGAGGPTVSTGGSCPALHDAGAHEQAMAELDKLIARELLESGYARGPGRYRAPYPQTFNHITVASRPPCQSPSLPSPSPSPPISPAGHVRFDAEADLGGSLVSRRPTRFAPPPPVDAAAAAAGDRDEAPIPIPALESRVRFDAEGDLGGALVHRRQTEFVGATSDEDPAGNRDEDPLLASETRVRFDGDADLGGCLVHRRQTEFAGAAPEDPNAVDLPTHPDPDEESPDSELHVRFPSRVFSGGPPIQRQLTGFVRPRARPEVSASDPSSAADPPPSPDHRPCPPSSDLDDLALDAIFDDDDLDDHEDDAPPVVGAAPKGVRWHLVYAIFRLARRGSKSLARLPLIAGHEDHFRREGGYLLKALTRGEGAILEGLHSQPHLRPFVPQFMGYVEREGKTFIKMQDVLLSMTEPNLIDLKMGVRSFGEEEVQNTKRRRDLLEKALVIQAHCPAIAITEEERQHGMSKYRFMSLRDHVSSTHTLGFRVQGLKDGPKTFGSRDFSTLRDPGDYLPLFRSFFAPCGGRQRKGLLDRLRRLDDALTGSEWFARHEFIGSSLLVAYDTQSPEKYGVWMIDFARAEEAPAPLRHDVPWAPGSHEDGYLLGLRSLVGLWAEVFDPE